MLSFYPDECTDGSFGSGRIHCDFGRTAGGHPSRSKWYHNYGYGNMRDYPLADHKVAVEQLAARHKFIDIDRVGIHGHSGGGFMSTAAICQYPDFYKAAVSCPGTTITGFITVGGARHIMV